MIPPRPVLRVLWSVHRWLFRLSGGRVGTRLAGDGLGTLVLETTSRRSGAARENLLYYLADRDAFVVVASNAGSDRDPGWLRNLRARPGATVKLAGRHVPVVAREATEGEAARLWPRLDAANPDYATYRGGTDRPIPIVILERTELPGRG